MINLKLISVLIILLSVIKCEDVFLPLSKNDLHCIDNFHPCTNSADCCSHACIGNLCIGWKPKTTTGSEPNCNGNFHPCSDNADCCSQTCLSNLCIEWNDLKTAKIQDPNCIDNFHPCTNSDDCCSHACIDNLCVGWMGESTDKTDVQVFPEAVNACNIIICNGKLFSVCCSGGIVPHDCFSHDNCFSVTCYC